ncbi:BH0509 family protein [Lysinibacillus yapensis]|uniref:BH0509 family protein n=1 Tax=Ureibacillus yapensis TaxID=2304605 RepID=A0A396SC15_9BACL|nr:BH0509 family protein [Lysinibacillus yapensis]RHW33973.1 BH0509 family protein [Lysinibacillus yapensis]
MLTEKERSNMIQFLEKYFNIDSEQLLNSSDRMLETTYEFYYSRKEMECDF